MSDVNTDVGGDQHGVGGPGEHRLPGLHPHQVRPSGGRLLKESGTPGTQLFKSSAPPPPPTISAYLLAENFLYRCTIHKAYTSRYDDLSYLRKWSLPGR